jgi:glucose-1-phosphate cytidylyltransferase
MMKVCIFAGGKGTRLMDETLGILPKPLIPVKGEPIVAHVAATYRDQGYWEFHVLAGFMASKVRDAIPWAQVRDTGEDTQTGGRLKRIAETLDEPFMATYADGLADVNLKALLEWHAHAVHFFGALATLTVHQQPSRFGLVDYNGGMVRGFGEKVSLAGHWINIGFYVFEPQVLELIPGDACVLERDLLPTLADQGRLAAYPHHGYFQCVDTWRDLEAANAAPENPLPWRRWANG